MLPRGGQRPLPSAMGFVRKECGMGFALACQAHEETVGAFLRLVNPGDSLHGVSHWHGSIICFRWEMTSRWPIRVISGSLLCALCIAIRPNRSGLFTSQDTSTGCVSGQAARFQVHFEPPAAAFA